MRNLQMFAASAIVAAIYATPAAAQEAPARISFNVQGGELGDVIREIALQAKASISIEDQTGSDVRVDGVRDTLTLRGALEQVLSGTDWVLEPRGDRSFRILRAGGSGDIVVTARREDFVRTSSSVLTRTDTPLRQTPGTITSVTEEVLESQNILSANEALRNLPGVIKEPGSLSLTIIGNQTNGGVTFTNGLRNSTIGGDAPLSNIEAIEIYKGPAAILTGTQVGGGVVNYVLKRATPSPLFKVSAGLGSGGEYFGTADIGGGLKDEFGLSGRLNLFYRAADHQPNGGEDPFSYAVNPMLALQQPGFRLDASLQFEKSRTVYADFYSFDPATGKFRPYGSRINDRSYSTSFSTSANLGLEADLVSAGAFELTLRARAQYQDGENRGQFQSPVIYDYLGMGSLIVNIASLSRDKNYTGYADLFAKFSTGALKHKVILAYDGRRRTFGGTNQYPGSVFTSDEAGELFPFAPNAPFTKGRDSEDGLILQHQMDAGRFHTLVGLRRSWYNSRFYDVDLFAQTRVTTPALMDEQTWLLNGGVVFDVSKDASVYVSYNEDFSPILAQYRPFGGGTLAPTQRERYEAGIKFGLFDNKLNINLSGYRYTTVNALTADILHPGFYLSVGGEKGKGAELSLSGSVSPTLKIIGGVAYAYGKRTDGTPSHYPKYTGNIYALKTFNMGEKRSIDLGFGANYNSGFHASGTLTPGFHYIDREYLAFKATLALNLNSLKFNASVDNIFDRANFLPATSIDQINIARPRTFRLTVTQKF